MRTIETIIYTFEELNSEAQQVAIDKARDINVSNIDWWDATYCQFEEKANELGFEDVKFYFSGFWSQGDGTMFEYQSINDALLKSFVNTLDLSPMRKNWILSLLHTRGEGKQSGLYCNHKSCNHKIYFEAYGCNPNLNTWLYSFFADFEDYVITTYENLCKELYKALEVDYNHFTSDEIVKETLIVNEYEFLSNGEKY